MATIQELNGVRNFYGPRQRYEGSFGQVRTAGVVKELVIAFSGEDFDSTGAYVGPTYTLPAGAVTIESTVFEIVEPFALGGTTPQINVGVSGSTATNYAAIISEAQAEAAGTYIDAPAGTLLNGAPLAADAVLTLELDGGGAETITAAGRCKMVITYQVI